VIGFFPIGVSMRFFNFSFLIIIGLLVTPAGCSFDQSGLPDIGEVTCSDNTLNGDETDVDCGGSCDKCESQKDCLINTDCISDFCNPSNICELNVSCLDETQNGNETDIDCGGSCDKCENGKSCLLNIDCVSDICDSSYICSGPSCNDQEQNGTETDVDCGGNSCDKCTTGESCLINSDCLSDFCNDSYICEINISCSDATQNGNETDIDCGGDICSPCIVDDSCLVDSDCETLSCSETTFKCLVPSCTDDATNGNETDLNCGGNTCDPCVVDDSCLINLDCETLSCSSTNFLCLMPSCTDDATNGNETDLNCGGNTCDPCLVDDSCLVNLDCKTLSCSETTFLCLFPSCTDDATNGNETDFNCGGNNCDPCVVDDSCLINLDCESLSCSSTNFLCLSPSCTDGATNGNETDLNCGGGTCAPCVAGKVCADDADCVSVNCSVANICLDTSCFDNTQNGNETDVDCGGITCNPCIVDQGCSVNSDCATDFCDTSGNSCQYATSCKDLLTKNTSIVSGSFSIIPPAQTTPLDVYCEVQGALAYTFYYVSGGTGTNDKDDTNTCDNLGLSMFVPSTESHYNYARDYALNLSISTTGDFLGPMGIYSPVNGDNNGDDEWDNVCRFKKMISGGGADTMSNADCGFIAITGGSYWVSELMYVSEPNGDYDADCWLNIDWNFNGDVSWWNDRDCDYTYNNYMCMSLDD
jgi:hypothetical protein